ncbi:hypothetical protein AKJ09_03816 [Labilithrix luteola]|uniref:Right handed beta helix domain-containing protein n=2 Tax=Labilithrix luteola TaxID=1391654 RepID=A0A0K1PUE8_9BACT|nr:hypothetical protein AKJ09_03816 [Labilithrix luteola]
MRLVNLFGVLVALVFLFLSKSAAAQASRTWVSGVGDDANPCSRTAPCKTFAGAISRTAAGGVISVLDPGGYGAVTITKSITIDVRGTNSSILNSGSNGVTVNAGATDTVILRGLAIQGVGAGLVGVKFVSGKSLVLEDCQITGQTQGAIDFQPATGTASLFMKNVFAAGNLVNGVNVGGAGTANVTITNSHFYDNVVGLHAAGTARVTIHDSVFGNNASKGIFCEGSAEVNMDHGLIAGNGTGVQGDSTVRLSEVLIGHNTLALAGAKVSSFGNNRVNAGNVTNNAPSTTLPQQ